MYKCQRQCHDQECRCTFLFNEIAGYQAQYCDDGRFFGNRDESSDDRDEYRNEPNDLTDVHNLPLTYYR